MMALLKNIRFYVLVASLLLSCTIYGWVANNIPAGSLPIIRLTQLYAFTALAFLYLTLLIGPAIYTFRFLPWRGPLFRARRALGVSAFCFACLHAYFAFFKQLGGFAGLGFLDSKYLWAISLSFTALVILGLMAATSFDRIVKLLTFRRWKLLHRFVYLAGFFILIHALLLGTHFSDLASLIPQIIFIALAFLLFLEARRLDAYLEKKMPAAPRFGLTTTLFLASFITYAFFTFLPATSNRISLNIHSQHLPAVSQLPPTGDARGRFTASFLPEKNVEKNKETLLSWQIFDALSGNPVQLFAPVYTKPMHLIIVNSDLTYFTHLHPQQHDSVFSLSAVFPRDNIYHLYVNFQPLGAGEQQFAFTLPVGRSGAIPPAAHPIDSTLTKVFGSYQVSLNKSADSQTLAFTLTDTATKEPIKNLKSYLGAFGHLVMINTKTFEYIHVHPFNLAAPADGSVGGPTVEFIPMGLYGPIKPGVYRLFAEFNPAGHLFTADFTINIP